jgi:hypothetical protein
MKPIPISMTILSHANFAARCSNIASIAAAWSRDSLTMPGYLDKPVGENAATRFLREMRQLLDSLEKDVRE